jgi:hypothetical protein
MLLQQDFFTEIHSTLLFLNNNKKQNIRGKPSKYY